MNKYVIDIETKPLFYAGVYNISTKEYKDYELNDFKSFLDNTKNDLYIMHNYENFDKHIIANLFEYEMTQSDIAELSDWVIENDTKSYWNRNIVIDTMKYVKKSLKDYAIEHDLPMSKFDFDNNTDIEELRTYLKDDVMATYHMFEKYVKKELNSTLTGWKTAKFNLDKTKIWSNFQSSRVLAPELINKNQNVNKQIDGDYELNFKDLNHITDANIWYKKIHWKEDRYYNANFEKEHVFDWKDNNIVLGFGGLHSHNSQEEFKNNIYHLDISSYYPNLIKLLLDGDYNIRRTISDSYFEIMNKRLELKKAGDPLNNSLKLFINSIYGLLSARGYETKIHNPLLQAMVCLTGQYQILHLLDMFVSNNIEFDLIQTNTDGIIIKTEQIEDVEKVRELWEKLNNNYLTFEVDKIKYYYGEDVNNYFCQYDNGYVKAKGRFKYDYNVNTKYSEIRHNLALNKLFINYKLGKKVLKIENNDYAITPNNKSKNKYGATKLYLDRNGEPYYNVSHDSMHQPNNNPILVTTDESKIDKEYYKLLATPLKLGEGSLMKLFTDKYNVISKDLKDKYGLETVASGYEKRKLPTILKTNNRVKRSIYAGGLVLKKTRKFILFDFDIDSQEDLDSLPEELKEIYNTETLTITSNKPFRKKVILKVNSIKKKLIQNGLFEKVEIFHSKEKGHLAGDNYNINHCSEIPLMNEEFEDKLRVMEKVSTTKNIIDTVLQKTDLNLTKSDKYEYGCQYDKNHRGTKYYNSYGNLIAFDCLSISCKNYQNKPKSDEITRLISNDKYIKFGNLIKNIISDSNPKHIKHLIEQETIKFIQLNFKRTNQFFDTLLYQEDIFALQLIVEYWNYDGILEMCKKHAKNTTLSWWGDNITIPNITGYDSKTNKFNQLLKNLANDDKHTYEQLVYMMNSIFNKDNNRNGSVFIFNGSGGNGKSFITNLIRFIMEDYSTYLIGIVKASNPKILLENKTGSGSSNYILNVINEIGSTKKLNNLLKDWYDEQTYRVMRENEERTYYRLSIPVLLSNHDFTMTGTDAIIRRQVRIRFTGEMETLKKKNNVLFMKNLENGFTKENITDSFKEDFWAFANYIKDFKLKRPKQSKEDMEAMSPQDTALKIFFDDYSIQDINEMKFNKELIPNIKEDTGLPYLSMTIVNRFLLKEYNYIQKVKKIEGKTVKLYVKA